jgi:transposase
MRKTNSLNLSSATYIGIDAHTEEHTAVAVNRFEEQKGLLRFDNSRVGINKFTSWLRSITSHTGDTIVGIEGAGNGGQLLISTLLATNDNVYEVNPLYTKQRREFGTKSDKSDPVDAKLIAEVLIRKLELLPKMKESGVTPATICLRKTVWMYEDLSQQKAKIKNHLHVLNRDWRLSKDQLEDETLNFIIGEKKNELKRIKDLQEKLKKRLSTILPTSGLRLISIKGISTVLAARLTAHIKDINRFKNINKFIQYTGIAPVERSSGKSRARHQNSRGNRLLNSTLYLVALNQARWNEKAREYFEKKIREGKTKKHALRCLMKRVACIVYGTMKHPREELTH